MTMRPVLRLFFLLTTLAGAADPSPEVACLAYAFSVAAGILPGACLACRPPRSADLQSAVSQVFNLPPAAGEQRSADYKSAIQQIKNLRYSKEIPRHAAPKTRLSLIQIAATSSFNVFHLKA